MYNDPRFWFTYKIRRSTDFAALQLWNVRSGLMVKVTAAATTHPTEQMHNFGASKICLMMFANNKKFFQLRIKKLKNC